jgi:hypothetical protein
MAYHGIDGADLVVRAIAGQLAQMCEGRRFEDDAHARHQCAKLFLRAVPPPSTWAKRRCEHVDVGNACYSEPGVRLREYAYSRIMAALGPLALAAAREIVRRMEAKRPRDAEPPQPTKPAPVVGSHHPFI